MSVFSLAPLHFHGLGGGAGLIGPMCFHSASTHKLTDSIFSVMLAGLWPGSLAPRPQPPADTLAADKYECQVDPPESVLKNSDS